MRRACLSRGWASPLPQCAAYLLAWLHPGARDNAQRYRHEINMVLQPEQQGFACIVSCGQVGLVELVQSYNTVRSHQGQYVTLIYVRNTKVIQTRAAIRNS